jgi:hypothetical protein
MAAAPGPFRRSARPPADAGGTRLRRLAWASVPVWSIGFLAFVPFLRLAVARRSGKDWAVFAGYLAAVVLEIVALSVTHTNSAWATATGGLIILLMGGGAAHSFVAFGNDPARAASPGTATSEQLNREALATARGRMERRREAREIAGRNPVLCRELRIGRPDLAREYDDGGLVDVNQVPGEILQSQLGLSADETAAVLAARQARQLQQRGRGEYLRAAAAGPAGRHPRLDDLQLAPVSRTAPRLRHSGRLARPSARG